MRRTRVLANLIAAVSLGGAGLLIVTSPTAGADTATPGYAYEGYFARNRPPAPQVDIPCTETNVRPQCGPASPATPPTPQAPDTGAYVVSSAGGVTGDRSDASGDTAWAAFSWDVFGQLGATVEKFVVTLTQTPQTNDPGTSRRNDTYNHSLGTPPPPIQACNIVVPWSAAPGANAWEDRPQSDTNCVVPTVNADKFTFDLTSMAQSWVEGTGFGILIMPGRPGNAGATTQTGADGDTVSPFQITFSGYETTITGALKEQVVPKVAFEFTPAPEDDLGGDLGGGGGGGDFFEEIITDGGGGGLEALPELDVIPTDVGSAPLPEAAPPAEESAAPTTRTRPISRDAGFPWIALLLLPFIAMAFWSTGTALGPVGDPVPAREGGVTRVLAHRHGSTDLDAR